MLIVNPADGSETVIGSGASLIVDVNRGAGDTLYALSQGPGVPGAPDGSPAQPDSGALVSVDAGGTLTPVVDKLDLPASVNFVGETAYVVTLNGEVWQIDDVSTLASGGSSAAISPPSTGDGGLLQPSGAAITTLGVVFAAMLLVSPLMLRRRLRA